MDSFCCWESLADFLDPAMTPGLGFRSQRQPAIAFTQARQQFSQPAGHRRALIGSIARHVK
jgi:hypothetical protein